MNIPSEHHDWHDALLDRGLAEVVGGETPPDLSERILAAAQTTTGPVTLAAGPATMSTIKQSSRMRSWAILAASIACIGTVIGLTVPASREAQHQARLAQREAEKLDRLHQPTSPLPKQVAGEQKKESLGFVPQGNIGLKGLINDANAPQPSAGTPLQMPATPGIIIDENERLSLSEEQGEQASAPVQFEPGEWQDLTARRKKYASVDLQGRGQRMRIDASPGATERPAVATASPTIDERNFDWPADRTRLTDVELRLRRRLDRFALADDADKRFYYDRQKVPSDSQWGIGPGTSGDQYTRIYENPFITAQGGDAVSTFSIDVDTASYANTRQFLQSGQLPPPDAVRIEELINYFNYDYKQPTDDTPFAANMEVAACPWNPEHRLARIAIKGKEMDRKARPLSNLVFLIDVSGSMDEPAKLPLLVQGMKQFTRELGENDRVAIVVYASSEGLALSSTRGDQQQTILAALDNLRAGGSTAGGAGIELAYKVALDNFVEGGVNRVILCTDGDFNVGVTSTADLERLAEEKARETKVFLTVLGFGRGNLNDAMMEAISGKGNGNYHYVDNLTEARKVLVEEMTGTLVTIAKDVKIQVEFNPAQVVGYRLIGYENRMLRTEDFNDDKKDAGEIGAGHTVTALYEIVPAGKEVGTPSVDPLKYQQPLAGLAAETKAPAKPQAASEELLTLKLRYKLPDADTSTKVEFPITDRGGSFADATEDFQFAAAVAGFGMLLRGSEHSGNSTFDAVLEIAQATIGEDPHGYRAEFLELARIAKQLSGEQPPSTETPSTTEGP